MALSVAVNRAGASSLSARKTFGKNVSCMRPSRCLIVRAEAPKAQAVQPLNGDPYVGMFETPITSNPEVVWWLSNLPAYRTGVNPLLRGVEVGLVHGFFLPGPFIKFGPLRAVEGVAEISGCLSAAGLVLILALAMSIYGSAQFQQSAPLGKKTLSGRSLQQDPLQTSEGWSKFTGGFTVGALSGVAWCYILTQILPYYS
eukprot:jgi/Chrzof1/7307/Cz02g18180.t1_PSAL[v5.2]